MEDGGSSAGVHLHRQQAIGAGPSAAGESRARQPSGCARGQEDSLLPTETHRPVRGRHLDRVFAGSPILSATYSCGLSFPTGVRYWRHLHLPPGHDSRPSPLRLAAASAVPSDGTRPSPPLPVLCAQSLLLCGHRAVRGWRRCQGVLPSPAGTDFFRWTPPFAEPTAHFLHPLTTVFVTCVVIAYNAVCSPCQQST